jgi:hypothetical protein
MTEPRKTPAPDSSEPDQADDRARPRRNDIDNAEATDGPPAAEPAAEDQAIDTAGTAADPDRPIDEGEGF